MKAKRKLILVPFLSLVLPAGLQAADVLEPAASIDLPSVKGRIDHFGVDLKRQRLFVAALGNDTLEVVDVKSSRRERSLDGFGEPQGVLYLPEFDPATGGSSGDIPLAAHPESFQLETRGTRIFVNVPPARHVAVVDRAKQSVVATWDGPGAESNYPM